MFPRNLDPPRPPRLPAPPAFHARENPGTLVTRVGRMPDKLKTRSVDDEQEREFIRTALKRFRLAEEAEEEMRREALEDLRFYAGQQWPKDIEDQRLEKKRPCLTINRLPPILRQVMNTQRQANSAMAVNPVGDGASVDTAEIIQGLLRHIEVVSQADIAYDTAFESMCIGGIGYWRILTDYLDEMSMDQEIRIEWIPDWTAVYMDPMAKQPNREDAKWCFIVSRIPREEYRAEYGADADVLGLNLKGLGADEAHWFSQDSIQVAEYYRVEQVDQTLVLLTDGSTAPIDRIPPEKEIVFRNGVPITRKSKRREVYWAKINGRQRLQERRIPGRYIPVIPCLGDRIALDGKVHYVGMVRNAKDGQRFFNFAQSGVVEQVALASKAPFMADDEAIEGYEDLYRTANTDNPSVLPFHGKGTGGRDISRPVRDVYEPPVQALTALLMQSDNNIKATIGLYDASLGQKGPQESGKAILARKAEGDESTYHLTGNLMRAKRHTAVVILDQIPEVYDNARIQRIVDPDDSHRTVPVNQPFITMPDGTHRVVDENNPAPEGVQPKLFDLTRGKYDVVAGTGKSYQSRRQEFVDSAIALVQSVPQIAQFILDLVVRHMDWPGAKEIADRLKKMLPEQLQEQPEGQPQLPPAVQAKIQAMMQTQAALVQALNKSTDIIEQKRMELESGERKALWASLANVITAEIRAGSSEAQTLAKADFAAIQKRLELLNVDQPIASPDEPAGSAQEAQPEPGGPMSPAAPAPAPAAPQGPSWKFQPQPQQ